eukprot:2812533-Amphidinium_carterae.1
MKSMEQPKVSGQVRGLIPGLMPLVQDPIGVRPKTHQLMSKRCMVLSTELLVATVANGPLDVGNAEQPHSSVHAVDQFGTRLPNSFDFDTVILRKHPKLLSDVVLWKGVMLLQSLGFRIGSNL